MNVPKFASFRPKSIPAVADNDEDRSRSKRPSRDLRRPDKRHRSRSREKTAVPESVLPSRDREKTALNFVVDHKGDVKNLVYGGLHRYDVALYRRIGAGSVLGVPRNLKIQRELSDEKGMVLSSIHLSRQRRREKYVFSKMEKPKLLKIRPQATSDAWKASRLDDFVLLDRHHSKKRKRQDHGQISASDTDTDANHYRSVEGKAKGGQVLDSDFELLADSDSSDTDFGDATAAARSKNVLLTRMVEKSPEDIPAWIALIDHQERILRGEDENRRITNAEMQSIAEIKIHMYEKALENAKTLEEKELLLSGLMAEGAKIWETREQMRKWEQIAEQHLESILLWKQYLGFKQTAFSSFQYEDIRKLYTTRFSLLRRKISEVDVSQAETLCVQLIYVLLRYALFVQESGFSELATSIWQAVLELNFRAPSKVGDWRASFKDFWESEVTRIGEVGSAGWGVFHNSPLGGEAPATGRDEAPASIQEKSLFRSWASAEKYMQQNARLPARTLDETVEDDPFRVILHSDIEEFLFILPHAPRLRNLLLSAFLLYCHQPPLSSETSDWLEDAFVSKLSSKVGMVDDKIDVPPFVETASSIECIFDRQAQNSCHAPEMLFSSHWFSLIADWKTQHAEDAHVSYDWFRMVLKQLLESAYTDCLGEYVLAFGWKNEPESVKKVAKGLLKKHSDSSKLYNAYAMIEWARGNKDIASAVFSAAINMSATSLEGKNADVILLWRCWIWCHLEEGDKAGALEHLLSIPNGVAGEDHQLGPAAVIKARQYLRSNRDYSLSAGSLSDAVVYAELLAILAYLTSTAKDQPQSNRQGDITAFLAEVKSFSGTLESAKHSQSLHHESLLQASARLFTTHARLGPFRPALLRSTLMEYLNLFPANTSFLSLFEWNESRFRIEGRVRTFLISQPKLSLSQHIFRIRYELQYGTIHSAKAAFEHALHITSQAKSNAWIWKCYILFTAKHFRAKAKDVWYRALRACPWVKELYVVGLELLDGEVERQELIGTWRVLGEKGLRVHVDLEDVLDEIQ